MSTDDYAYLDRLSRAIRERDEDRAELDRIREALRAYIAHLDTLAHWDLSVTGVQGDIEDILGDEETK